MLTDVVIVGDTIVALGPGYEAKSGLIGGKFAAENGQMTMQWQDYKTSNARILQSIKLNTGKRSLAIPAQEGHIRVIGIIPDQLTTTECILKPAITGGEAVSDTHRDILKLACIERHHQTGNVGLGFVRGMGLQTGAIASSIGHDCHNITVVGTNDDDMLEAIRAIENREGGLVDVDIFDFVPLWVEREGDGNP